MPGNGKRNVWKNKTVIIDLNLKTEGKLMNNSPSVFIL